MLRLGRESPAALALTLGVFAPASGIAQSRAVERLALRLELGAGAMVSPYQRNDDPSEYGGNVKGYRSAAFQGTARLALRVFEPLSLQVSVANWVFPSTTEAGTGWVFAPTGGLHIEPRVGAAGRLFVDANVGAAFTGLERRVALDVGAGFEFDVSAAIALGPVLRYGQVVQPETLEDGSSNPFPQDARYVSVGLSLALRVPPREPAEPAAVSLPRPPEPPRDSDGDATLDPDDLCPSLPAGEHPDPVRRGCPDADSDADGVFDAFDLCRSTPQGAHPDPARAGCPDPDGDRDGVSDHVDQCPAVAQGPRPDPARAGCPEPDRDSDGVPDGRDRCPDRPETFNNFEDADGCPDRPSLVTISDGMIRILGTINFATASDRILGRRSFDILDSLVAIIAAHREIARLEVQGHTDDRGDRAMNQQLSQRRADAVRLYLMEHGIAGARLSARGFGPDRPLVPNGSMSARAQNRRVEMHILQYADGTLAPAAAPFTPPPTAAR
jgi:outer membrane protein OmpA-like peptidoglycan-associated protein